MSDRSIVARSSEGQIQWSVGRLVAVAACLGLLGGVGEVGLLAVRRFVLGRPIWLGLHLVWMAPLAGGLITAFLASIPGVVARIRWPASAPAVTAGIAAFVASWGLLILEPRLHEKALLLPAAGIGYQLYRYTRRRPDGTWNFVRRVGPWALGLVTAMGLVVGGLERGRERLRIGRLPPESAGRPNVLLLVMDTQRAASMSLHGYHRPTTPELEVLAAEGTVFERAMSVASWTLPGHAGFFVGRYPHQISGSWGASLGHEDPTLAEVLTRHGYATAGFVANTFYCQREFGLDRGFIHYEDFVASPGEFLINSSLGRRLGDSRSVRRLLGYHDILARRDAGDLNRQLLRWLDRRPARPFFAFVNYFDVHAEYLPPPPYDNLYGTRIDRPLDQVEHRLRFSELRRGERRTLPEKANRAQLDAYDGAIAYLDHEIGRLLDGLERRRLLDSTLVIVTSDHGEQFGEHGLFLHGNSLYTQAVHVPLVLRLPGAVPAGLRILPAASLRDLPATILELTGAATGQELPGASLSRHWRTEADTLGVSPAFSLLAIANELHHSLVSGRYHYLRKYLFKRGGKGPTEMLFDLDTDPEELVNLADRPELGPVMGAMRDQVKEILADSGRMGSRPSSSRHRMTMTSER